ncbi:hypothetical protein ACU42Y_21055 [Proteus mirabilis]
MVLTDREDLDTQIYKTFAGCGLVDNDKDPCRADSGKDLKELIGQQKAFVFTLIQKFNEKVDLKSLIPSATTLSSSPTKLTARNMVRCR